MSCYHPLTAVDCWRNDEGNRVIKIFPQDAEPSIAISGEYKDVFQVPCGHCLGCRTDQSKEWANRLLMESMYHENAYFITLTYCDEYLRYNGEGVDLDSGELISLPTLWKPDFQKFMKRLRRCAGEEIRFYAAGEYGEKGNPPRPHYHAIIFGTNDNFWKLVPCGRSETGQQYYSSEVLERLWSVTSESDMPDMMNSEAMRIGKNPNLIGWCSIEPANYFTMKYVAAYVTKKLGMHPNYRYEMENRIPPFSLSSRKPGIGFQYLIDHPECINDDRIVIGTPQGKIEFPVPRYFKKKAADQDPGLYDELVEKHMKISKDKWNAILSQTDLTEKEYLEVRERNHYNRLKQRNKI